MNDKWKNLGNRLSAAWSRPVKPTFKRPKEGDIFNEEKFKSRVLRGLADELRANTKWLRGAPISLTLFQHVYVDGLEDITQAEMMPLTLTL